eukprot:CAMPEP_0184540880 /NCGR_PEP_ID=MMETSP0199_2-20130426/1002_1 /TAXON_ID=1112570 /ORGANISM="Thraustochytrium sp., Strain LLF1b" /LENGTH=1568 /DNA_ID=CAMNT_0026934549 /DNA_START=176 /DNA_END=4882 /DNA_ORIENTATION=+
MEDSDFDFSDEENIAVRANSGRPKPKGKSTVVLDSEESEFGMSEDEKPKPKAKAKAKAKPKAKAKKAPVVEDDDELSDEDMFDSDTDALAAKAKSSKRSSMERAQLSTKYQKKSQYEHIMLRPDTYIGSTEKLKEGMWVFENDKMVFRTVTYVPGLYKIFDEILVNASDNKQRDPNMKTIKITINKETGEISVWNDGKGIPVEMHAEHHIYIPELVFGHLMTGENFEDTQKRVVGGRNGYGAKLANIFSSNFVVETNDSRSGYRYRQEWTNNMSEKGEPKLTKASGKDFTCVTFTPDYKRFGMPGGLDRDTLSLLTKRAYDVAGVTHKSVKVHLNGKPIAANTFEKYIDLYLAQDEDKAEESDNDSDGSEFEDTKKKTTKAKAKGAKTITKVYERINDRWEVCIAASTDGQMQQVSFVNGICTTKGGPHVNYVADQIVSKLQVILKKKHKGTDFKPHQIKGHLWIFVNSLIVNPAFDSQTKETLTTRHAKFGPSEFLPKLSDKSLKSIEKTPIVSNVLYWAKAKEMRDLSKKAGGVKKNKIKGVEKLDDANNAGGRNSQNCTLILTEGDSAKTLAISGLSVVGRDNFGVFPLRGKLLNVRDAAASQIIKNEEIQNIMKIMGLQPGKEYTDTRGLRYGHLMIMTDQDHDGSHIKGLLMNFIHHFWPALLKIDGFLQVFVTPIVKATKGSGAMNSFYTMPQYQEWLEAMTPAQRKAWKIKYYKGLGTSTAKEAKEYFAMINKHRILMEWEGDEAGDALELAFSKTRVNDRKNWLSAFKPGTHMDFDVERIQFQQFVNKELILFSMADNIRSIPSMIDGLKPSQRKVLFSCFKRNLKSDVKVAQLVGYASEHSAYHHGDVSLAATVVGMAQTFVGSNNINLLYPSGQFGSRIMGGKDAASSRYIFTRLAKLTRFVFHQKDDAVLEYQEEDGLHIEPNYYAPIIPFVLVNGASGIGTGWSTDIPCYKPRDLIAYLRRKLINCEPEGSLIPWYKNFTGTIEPEIHATKGFTGRFIATGSYERDDDDHAVIITELPIGTWTQNYKQFLMDEKVFPEGFIKDVRENHTDTRVSFTVYLSKEAYQGLSTHGKLVKKFKLESSISTTNMHAFDASGAIKRYISPEAIIDEFYNYRLEVYAKRKEHLEAVLESQWSKLENRARFIQMVIDGEIIVTRRKKAELLRELEGHGFKLFLKETQKAKVPLSLSNASAGADADDDNDSTNVETHENETQDVARLGRGYDYLLSMPIWTLIAEKVAALNAERDQKRNELEILQAKKPHNLWEEDLDAFEEALTEQEAIDAEEELQANSHRRRAGGGRAKNSKRPIALKQQSQPAVSSILEITRPKLEYPSGRKPKTKNAIARVKAERLPTRVEPKKEVAKEDEEILSLSERLKARMMVSPAREVYAKKRSKEATPIRPAKPLGVVESPLPGENMPVLAATPKMKPKDKRRKMKTVEKIKPASGSSAMKEEQVDTAKTARAKNKKPAAAPKPKRAAAAKAKVAESESEESLDELDSDESDLDEMLSDSAPMPKTPLPKRRARAAAPAKSSAYVELSESSDFDLSSDEDCSESDFE